MMRNFMSLGIWLERSGFLETLAVNPDSLRQKASETEQRIGEMKTAFEALEQAVDRTAGYWLGEAGDAHRAYFAEKRPEFKEILNRLSEQVRDLNQMADVYDTAERQSVEMAADLPSDVIV